MRAPAWAGDKEKKVLRGDDAWEELNMTAVENMFKARKNTKVNNTDRNSDVFEWEKYIFIYIYIYISTFHGESRWMHHFDSDGVLQI
jgi:hypothetical protein